MKPNTSELSFTRQFTLPPAKLWYLLTDPKMREIWGAPSEDATLVVEEASELSEGGYERHRCGPKDNPEFVVETRWYSLQDSELATFTETLLTGGHRIFTTLVTYGLTPVKTGTRLDIEIAISGFSDEDMRADIEEGWTAGLATLDKLAAREDANA
ncbi:MAG: SRPBCC domain-containing protein [Pseudomonadota bacterium]